MARSKRKPSNRTKAKTVVTPSESEDLDELTPDQAAAADTTQAEKSSADTAKAGGKKAGDKKADTAKAGGKKADGATSDRASGGKAAAAAGAKDPVSKQASKDPVSPRGGKGAKSSGSEGAARSKDPVAEKAKDPAKSRHPKRAAQAEGARTGRRAVAATQNPAWLVPTALTLLILGLVYLVAYYLSAGTLPLPIGDWNLAVGFGVMLVGGGMLMFWK